RELADVSDGLERLAQGIGMIVTVTGEPGIGKSRLVADAVEPLRDRMTVLEGRALSYTGSFPYWPVRELLRDWLGAGATAAEAGSWRVGERARQRFPHRYREIELRPLSEAAGNELLGDLAGAPVSDNVSALLTQRAGGNPLFLGEALRDLIERGALQRSDNGW